MPSCKCWAAISQIRNQSLVIDIDSVPSIFEADNLVLQMAHTRI